MEDIADWSLKPDQAVKIAVARQDADARGLLFIPEVREGMPRSPLRLKGDRQIEHDDEVLSKAHIVDHWLMRRGNVSPSLSTASSVDHHIAQCWPTCLIGDGDQF